ncbi:RHS repeat-associated protein [Saccharothrix coeruleofusca]|uniref:HNH/endonuclease VII fold putative polymorphic toxin n=1 Tax=Saccharothrix coeruleofusca TaxID=33919 RepID=UPI001AE1A6CD|nr:HNH/endonuclease VII fold putative polymorphic toxin [Saccharothrix coeruleofusca]MBP2337383.1 RHS repeat-associated protein [Saccharothrix coeruleofusca]
MSAGSPSWRKRAVAFGVVLVLAASSTQAVAAPDTGTELPVVPKEKPLQVNPIPPRTPQPDPNAGLAITEPAKVVWPRAARSEVDFAATGGTPAQVAARVAGTAVRAAGTPVSLAVAGDQSARRQAAVGTVRVEVADPAATQAVAPYGVVFSLVDGGNAANTPLDVHFDYESFADAFGGGYGSRLKLTALPSCALSTPDKPECRTATPVPDAVNNTAARLLSGRATLTQSGQPAVFAVTAAASGESGTYKATSLAPAGSWSAGGSSGDFTYGYPMRVPPAIAGAAPSVSLGYSSQSVDGRTSATNNQATWAGDGWDVSAGGFIERQYKPCSLDLGGNNGQTKTGDQCWATDNATISLAGVSGKLIRIPGTNTWRAQADDGARVELLTGAANGDEGDAGRDVGEHWKVTTTDGTQYFLGLNRLPGWSSGRDETQSVWTTPVYGNHGGESCNRSTFDASWCQQGYRWNVDYSVDPNGNVTTYYYEREFNHYGRNADAAKGTPYVRGGHLKRIEYGLRADNPYAQPGARIDFETAERCLPGGAVTCDPSQIKSSPSSWPDVPADQICNAGEQCTNRNSASFFTRKRLTKVVTRVANGSGGFQDVDSWSLEHAFLPTGDGNPPSLNLTAVVHTGLVGTPITLPPTKFGYRAMPNRVDGVDTGDPWTRYRIDRITGEGGAITEIRYSEQDCVPGSRMPASPENNTLRCYPIWWTPDGAPEPIMDWFHKYVVTTVVDDEFTGGSKRIPTYYEYSGTPAWHFDDNEFAEPNRRTWSQWRGYETVRTAKGGTESGEGPQTVTETVYHRGMDGDKQPNGTREVWVRTSEGEPVRDADRLRGFVRETRQYNNGEIVSASVNDPYLPQTPTATDTAGNKAFVTGNEAVRGRTKLENGTWRRTKVVKSFNAEGIATQVEDHGDLAVTGDESCTRTQYARNEAAWMLTYAQQVETVVGTCAVTASPTTIMSLARSYYDGQNLGVPPTRGLITKAEALDKWDASGQTWVTASTSSYDAYGRPLDVHDAMGQKTSTAYTPSTGPATQISSTNALGHTATETVDPAWGASTASVDANGRRTDLVHDALGRLTAVWLPGHDKTKVKADAVFEYYYNTTTPSVVVSKKLQENDQYLTAYTLYDGLMRERQTQTPAVSEAGGRQLSDIFYDSRGLPYKTNGTYWDSQAPDGKLTGTFDNAAPSQTITQYDGLERPVKATFRVLYDEKWHTTTSYGGDRVHTVPPSGATATTVINDAQGRTVEKRQYKAGLGGEYDATKYTYTAAGLLETVTDPAGNVWRYGYDLRGRKISADDPDTGHSTTTYNAAGQVTSTTDAEGRTVATTYDPLGRPSARYEGSPQGTKLADWEYDSVIGGLGLPAMSRRWVDGAAYTKRTTKYDAAGRPEVQQVSIPSSKEGVLGTTYELVQRYNYSGQPTTTLRRAVTSGGVQIVPSESVTSGYNTANGVLNTTSGTDTYVAATTYNDFGEVEQEVHGPGLKIPGAKNVVVTNSYEVGTRRLSTTRVTRTATSGNIVADRGYSYDAAGNITRIADTPEGAVPDIQCFAYDYLRRMTDAWTPSTGKCGDEKSATALGGAAPYWHSWTFDKTGNRITETQHAAAGDTVRTTTYPQPGSPQPHTALSVTTTGPNGTARDTFGYDATGNTTTRKIGGDEQVLSYDAEGRVAKVRNPDGKESSYLYDADGERLISREPSATTLYVFGQEIRLETGTSTPTWTRQYTHGGRVVAVRNSVTGLKWVLPDHQGTNLATVSATTMEVTHRRQTPFGGARGGLPATWPDRLGFVGGRNDESGLTRVGARLYDAGSGRFLSVDPIIDNNDPQQLNGYAYSNNSPVTFSDPTGLRSCGPDGVLCGRYIKAIHGSQDQFNKERETFTRRARVAQFVQSQADEGARKARRAAGISDEEYARALADAHKTKWDVIKEVAWEAVKDISGWNDIVDCFTKGDIWACGGMIAGLVPWGKIGKVLEAGYKAVKAVASLASIVEKARGVLRRVDSVTAEAQRVANESFAKLGNAGESCALHSFVGSTRVLMADGSTKPIAEVDVGDKVKATDPTTGETSDREVVGTIVHSDEGDMTRLTVRAEDGTTGSVDATSWHPVWSDSEKRFIDIGDLELRQYLTAVDGTSPQVLDVERYVYFEPVYDITVDSVHTYYVVLGATSALVHNCAASAPTHKTLPSRNAAFREAKRDLGIPMGRQPVEVNKVPMTDRNGSQVMDGNGRRVMTREYTFEQDGGNLVIIQDHSYGHRFGEGGVGDQGAHLNVRPHENPRTGKIPGTAQHYEY